MIYKEIKKDLMPINKEYYLDYLYQLKKIINLKELIIVLDMQLMFYNLLNKMDFL